MHGHGWGVRVRSDETGQQCPSTLGEYRDYVASIVGEGAALRLLDAKIAASTNGREEPVAVTDSQMRALLFPLMASDLLAGDAGGSEP